MSKIKLPREIITTACLSGGLSTVISLTSAMFSILIIAFRYDCSVAEPTINGAQYFLITVMKTYILDDDCAHSLKIENLTKADSVFIMALIILVFAFINFLTAVTMIIAVNKKLSSRNVDIYVYIFVGSSLALFVVDFTLGVHFGIDHELLKNRLRLSSAGFLLNYETDMIRLGALLLMSIALKGYIGHAVNIALLILLTVYVVRYQRKISNEYPDHISPQLNVLHAFDPITTTEESPWRLAARVGLTNPAYNGDEIHQWVSESLSPQPRLNDGMGARPFSYLENGQRPSVPQVQLNWRPLSPMPTVPAPDYSPPSRKLKSALKSAKL